MSVNNHSIFLIFISNLLNYSHCIKKLQEKAIRFFYGLIFFLGIKITNCKKS